MLRDSYKWGRYFVDFREKINVWHIHLNHSSERKKDVGDVEGCLRQAERIGEVNVVNSFVDR